MDDSGEIVEPMIPSFPWRSGYQKPPSDPIGACTVGSIKRKSVDCPCLCEPCLGILLRGPGLSRVLDDLGAQGEPPVHPELLDWLAVEFMESGWNIKHIVKLIVTSNTYRQSSKPSEVLDEKDAYNRLTCPPIPLEARCRNSSR